MTLALAFLAVAVQVPTLERGHDPWVFRCIFEDRTRMVIVAAGEDVWFAFNPETCGLYKIWKGEMDFRGKVYDFSQNNSRAKGTIWYEAWNQIDVLEDDSELGPDWVGSSVTWADGWTFDGTDASLTSPAYDLSGWQRVFLAFDEKSRAGPIRMEVSGNGGESFSDQWFDSTLHVSDGNAWQWNFKQIEVLEEQTVLRFRQLDGSHNKLVKGIRLFGDKPVWFDKDGRPLKVHWRGYSVQSSNSVMLNFDLEMPEGSPVKAHVWFDRIPRNEGWLERYLFSGIQEGQAIEFRARLMNGRARFVSARGESGGSALAIGGNMNLRFDRDGVLIVEGWTK